MSNIERIPLQDNYEVELAQGITDTALTFSVDTAPSYTPTTRKTWAVLNPGRANMELVKVDGYDAGTKVVTIPTGGRAQPLYEGHTATAYAHGSGSVVMISDNFAFWDSIYDAVNSKLDSNGGNTGSTFDLDLTGSSWRLRNDAGLMKFTDDQQAEVSLKTLADAAGVNDKTKVSNADTTTGYLNAKIAVGTGLSTSIINPAGNEQLQIDLDDQYIAVSDHLIYTPAFLTGGTSAEGTFSNWLAVLAGSFRITLDGVAYNVDGIDFTGVTSMADVATYIQTALRTASSTLVTVVWSTNRFIFTSANTTSSSAITVLETSTGTVGTDISGAGASNWIDADTGNGVVTNAVLNRVADAGKTPILDASGNLKSTLLEANLREADTFFGITTMTGAQANTLSAGPTSNADSLHTHLIPPYFSCIPVTAFPKGDTEAGQITTDSDGAYLYIFSGVGTTPNINKNIYPYQKDANTNMYYSVTGNVSLVEGTYGWATSTDGGIVAGSTYVYLLAKGASDIKIVRFTKALGSATVVTISGTATTLNIGRCAGNDTSLYVMPKTSSTAILVYSVSGTTATRGTDIVNPIQGQDCRGFWFDGTDLIIWSASNVIYRINTAGASQGTVSVGGVTGTTYGYGLGLGYRTAGTIYEFAVQDNDNSNTRINAVSFTKP